MRTWRTAARARPITCQVDRDELRSQGPAFQGLFGADAAIVSSSNPQKNARILIVTYQTLDVDSDEADASFLAKNYPENCFSHIVINECHRSAWGKWSLVLTRNPDAVEIGLTATPRRLELTEHTKESEPDAQINADNLRYFGESVYEYDMSQRNRGRAPGRLRNPKEGQLGRHRHNHRRHPDSQSGQRNHRTAS